MINQKYHLLKKGGKVKKSKQKQKQKQTQRQATTQIVKVNVNAPSRRRRGTSKKRSSSEKREEFEAKPNVKTSFSLNMPSYNPAYSQIPTQNRGFNVQDIKSLYELIKQQNDNMLKGPEQKQPEQQQPEPEQQQPEQPEQGPEQEYVTPNREYDYEPVGEEKHEDDDDDDPLRSMKKYDTYIQRIKELFETDSDLLAHKKLDQIAQIYNYKAKGIGNLFRTQGLTKENLEDIIYQQRQLKDIDSRAVDKAEKRRQRRDKN